MRKELNAVRATLSKLAASGRLTYLADSEERTVMDRFLARKC